MFYTLLGVFLEVSLIICGLFYYFRLRQGLRVGETASKFENLNVGHRGCRFVKNVQENSLKAFQYAIEQGADAIELDCRLTKDGAIVVFHDDVVDNQTNGTGVISCMTLKEVQGLRFKNVVCDPSLCTDTSCRIPLLEDVLMFARRTLTKRGKPVKVFVELKALNISGGYELGRRVGDLITKLGQEDISCVISFNPIALYSCRAVNSNIEACMLYKNFLLLGYAFGKAEKVPFYFPLVVLLDPALTFLAAYVMPSFIGCTMLGPHADIMSMEAMQRIRNRGYSVYVWVVNEAEHIPFFMKYRASVGTDCLFPITTGRYSLKRTKSFSYVFAADPEVEVAMPADTTLEAVQGA